MYTVEGRESMLGSRNLLSVGTLTGAGEAGGGVRLSILGSIWAGSS